MKVKMFIVDDFLPNPDHVREQVLKLDFGITGQFPGARSYAVDEDFQMFIMKRIESIMGVKVDTWLMDSFCYQLCYEDVNSWVHKDTSDWAAVLYLTPNAPIESGTGIYKEITPDEFELQDAVSNIYNRIVIYRGDQLHKSLLSGFGNDPESGRLTQVFFFNTITEPAGGWDE